MAFNFRTAEAVTAQPDPAATPPKRFNPATAAPVGDEKGVAPTDDGLLGMLKKGGRMVADALDPVAAIPDLTLTAVTGAVGATVGGAAGLGAIPLHAAGVIDTDPAAVRDAVSGATTWQPVTNTGRGVVNAVGKGAEWLEEQKQRTTDIAAGKGMNPDLVQGGLNAAQAALEYLPAVKGARAAAGAARATGALPVMSDAEKAAHLARPTPANRPEEVARALGLKMRPSDVRVNPGAPQPGIGARMSEAVSDRVDMGRDFSIDNAAKINAAAAKDIGLPDGAALDEKSFTALRKPAEAVYSQVAQLPETITSPEYNAALKALKGDRGAAPEVKDAITALQAEFAVPGKPNDMLASIKALRSRAKKQIASDDVKANEIGYANKRMAGLLEDELERVAVASGNAELLQQFRAARRDLAKINTVEDVTRAGQIDAAALKKARDNGAKLDGRLAAIADAAEFFPEVTKHPHQVISAGADKPPPATLFDAVKRGVGKLGPERYLNKGYQNSIFPEGEAALARYFEKPPEKPLPAGAAGPNPFGGPEGPQAADLRARDTRAADRGLAAEILGTSDGPLPGERIEWDQRRGGIAPLAREVRRGAPSGVELADQPAQFFPDGGDLLPADMTPQELALGGRPTARTPQGELTLADLLLGDSPGFAPEPFRPAAGDVVRADRNMAPREMTAGSTTGRLTPVDIFGGGEPLADVLLSDELGLAPEPFRPAAGDVVPFTREPALDSLIAELGLAPEPRGGVRPRFEPDTSAAGDLEVSPLPRQALAEANLSLADDVFERPRPAVDFDAPAPEPGLSLADEVAPPRTRREPGQPETKFPERYKTPGAQRRETDAGYIAFEEKGKDWNINDAFVKEEKRGGGVGKAQLLDLAVEARDAGKTLNSDKSLTKAQARVYESLRKAGKLEFDITDQKAWDAGLESGTIRAGGKPVITNIRPGPKVK